MEEWRTIQECENYEVSNTGKVRNKATKRPLKLQHNEYGYVQVILHDRKRAYQKMRKVHRLVAIAFLPNPDNLSDVNHIDENKDNNTLQNLEWSSHKDNLNHGTRNERIKTKLKTIYGRENNHR